MSYGDDFKVYGPYQKDNGRKFVILIEKNGKRRTVSYPKWIMELQIGRKLDPDLETIDHWDSDFENNDIDNLRILPRAEHTADDAKRVKLITLNCAWCDCFFKRSPSVIRFKAKNKKAGPFCSRKCAGLYGKNIQLGLVKKFKSQKPIKSEYYKRKYASADSDLLNEDLIDLICDIYEEE